LPVILLPAMLALLVAATGEPPAPGASAEESAPPPLTAAALCGRGRILLEDERAASLEEARGVFQRAVETHPSDPCGHAGLSRTLALLYVRGAVEDDAIIAAALAAARTAVGLDEASAEAHAALSRALWLDQQEPEADNAAMAALEKDCGSVPALLAVAQSQAANRQHELARATLGRAASIAPHLPALHLALGNVALLGGEETVALAHFQDALALSPGYVPAKLQMAAAIEAMGGYSDAADILREVLEEHPQMRARVQLFMAISLMKRRQWEEALIVLPRAEFRTRRWLSAGTVSWLKGMCLEELDRRDEALAAYRDVIENHPLATAGFSDSERLIFRAYEAVGRIRLASGDIEGAAAAMEEGALRTGASLDLALRLAGLYTQFNLPAKAAATLEKAVARPMTTRGARVQLQAYVAWARLLPQIDDAGARARLVESLASHDESLRDIDDTVRDLDAMRVLSIAGAGAQSLAWLQRAVARGYAHVGWILDDPEMAGLREAPGFDAIIAGVSRGVRPTD